MTESKPNILVFSSLFPSSAQPNAGLFIRERMFRVGERLPVTVVSPVPWFLFQSVIRWFKPNYRPMPPEIEVQQGITVYYPRFFSLPGVLRHLDGFFMAVGARSLVKRLTNEQRINLIDAHFAYPDGYAANLLGKWLNLPVTITLRGTEVPMAKFPERRKRMIAALDSATRVFAVADSLKKHVVNLGANAEKIRVVGNGVDIEKFHPIDKAAAREQLNIDLGAKVLVSIGALTERKGFHRVIDCFPQLVKKHPDLLFLVVGGVSGEGDWRQKLDQHVQGLKLENNVRFLGILPSEQLYIPLSAGDAFVLATRNEGWANVFLEAMACGLPVVTTDVGGNKEVVCNDHLGTIVPFGDEDALQMAIKDTLEKSWDSAALRDYACDNSWDNRVDILESEFRQLISDFNYNE